MPAEPELQFVVADLDDAQHQQVIVELIDAYARDPYGGGRPLADEVKSALVPGLRNHPTTLVVLAYRGAAAIGIAVCFRGFSTFQGRPLLNIHDFAVLPSERGRGVGRGLMAAVEAQARAFGCCKLTLEVQEHNHTARRVYAAAGFGQAIYEPEGGGQLFLSKPL